MDTTALHSALGTSYNLLTIIRDIVVVIVGVIGIVIAFLTFAKGGFRLLKAANKINRFINKVDRLINNFLPDIFDGLEKKGFLRSGTLARWTSMQAEILEAKSPISITERGLQIIAEIGFDKLYADNKSDFQKLIRRQLEGSSNVTEYDVEQASLRLVAELFDAGNAWIKSAETYSFNNPQMPIAELKTLLAIFVRDQILNDPDITKEFRLPPAKTNEPPT